MLYGIGKYMGREAWENGKLGKNAKKMHVDGLAFEEMADAIGNSFLKQLMAKPQYYKMYFFWHFYVFWYTKLGETLFGMGIDPDFEEYFKSYS